MTLFHHIVDRGIIKRRRNDNRREFPLSSLLDGFQCIRQDEHISYGASATAVPPFGCTFSSAPGHQNNVAVANEEGLVSIIHTGEIKSCVLKEWQAHDNAVFDIAWVPGANSLVTASGDQTARMWDVITGDLLGTFKGHQCSLKSVAFAKQERAVFSTGGRDGNIMLWDTRCSKKDGYYRQVKQISGAHMKPERHTPQTKKRRGMAPPVDSQQGVTVVLFCDDNKLISSGAVDGTIKMWDLRKNYTAYHHNPLPLQAYPYPGCCTRKLGYSGLSLDSTGSRLFSNCTDDNIYMFDISGLKTTPVAVFRGHSNSSFYVKSSVSPDDQFLASGSSDHHAYIWKISDPQQGPMMLQGHSQEVTSVAWCPTDFTKIASCSDDNTVRIWRLNRKPDGQNALNRDGNVVGWTLRKIQSPTRTAGPLSPVTPAKSPLSAISVTLSSPQPAMCAPTGADLPLPSNTSAPAAKVSSSIQQWISRKNSPAQNNVSPCRKVLKPVLQGSCSERRAKRRLETGDGSGSAVEEESDGVSELYPDVKRSKSSLSAYGGSSAEEKRSAFGSETEGSSAVQIGKENSSPGKSDWLSVFSQKLKGSTQLKSPSNKRQDVRTPGSPAAVSPRPAKIASSSPAQKSSPSRPMKKISSYFIKRTQD